MHDALTEETLVEPYRRKWTVASCLMALLLVVAVGACGSDSGQSSAGPAGSSGHEPAGGDAHTEGDEAEITWGAPGEAQDADRVIEIDAADDFSFTPSEVAVVQGETVTFRVHNSGKLPHDFTLGDEETQDEHEEEMADMPGGSMHDEVNAMTIDAGQTEEMTWTFDATGTIIMGCHIPGHYRAGMKGTIVVSAP